VITIRRFRVGDLPRILTIERESFGTDAWPAELFREYAAECPEMFLVARAGLRVAGYSITCMVRHGAEIASIAVLPRFRGRGIARALLARSIRMVRRREAAAIWLMVRRDNRAAIELYRSFGFARTGTVYAYYEDGSVAWRMRLDLGPSRRGSAVT
jgi:ribosomal-protein-alanine acetyltransferase